MGRVCLVSVVWAFLLLVAVFGVVLSVPLVRGSGTISIRADGSIDPPTAPIQRVGDYYTFTANIYDSIIIERNNIVVDGAGYTVQGAGSWAGIDLEERSNVTIKNAIVKGFRYGINLNDGSSHNSIFGNNITENQKDGISLYGSSYNSIFSNSIIENHEDGIDLVGFSKYNNIYGNNIIENDFDGIAVGNSSDNRVYGNNITENDEDGIDLTRASYNSMFGNNIVDNWFDGIDLDYSSNYNQVFGNSIMGNDDDGIDLYNSSHNSIYGNNITDNWSYGIDITYSANYNNIYGNNVTNHEYGIYLLSSSNNNVSGNNIAENGYGVYPRESSSNLFYHNNFVNKFEQVYVSEAGYANVWDDGYPSGGNYWSDYTGVDANGDSIGDTPYIIDSDNQDRYPLTTPYTILPMLTVSLTLNPTTANSENNVSVQVHVAHVASAVEDALVQLVSDKGGIFTPQSGYTNSNGDFTSTFTAPTVTTQTTITISTTASKSGYLNGQGQTQVTVQTAPLSVTVIASPTTIQSGQTSTITTRVTYDGTPISAATVTLSSDEGGTLSATSGNTDSNGYFTASFTAPSVTTQTAITIRANATKAGYLSGQSQAQIMVDPSQPPPQPDQTVWTYLAILVIILLTVVGGVVIDRRKRHKPKQVPTPP